MPDQPNDALSVFVQARVKELYETCLSHWHSDRWNSNKNIVEDIILVSKAMGIDTTVLSQSFEEAKNATKILKEHTEAAALQIKEKNESLQLQTILN